MTIESLHRTGIVFPSFFFFKNRLPILYHYLRISRRSNAKICNEWQQMNNRKHLSLIIFSPNACVSLSRNKKYIGNSPVEEAKKINCYKRVICQNVSRTVVELCMETPYWSTVLVHQYGRRKSTKTSGVHFFYKSSFFPSRTSIRTHKHIF